ncbi:hypothetical protein [Actinomadura sp. NBRC 104412]|nr:hypothetical protein [Actinomadura sp. NBRC 104412]
MPTLLMSLLGLAGVAVLAIVFVGARLVGKGSASRPVRGEKP